jgi:hypothetical protein
VHLYYRSYQPIGHAQFAQRLSNLDQKFNSLLNNHNNDPTGAEGEQRPLWFEARYRLAEFQDSNTNQGQQQAQRANMHEVQAALGAAQRPLGPGAPALCSEVAAENPPQLDGPDEIGAEMEVRQVHADTVGGNDHDTVPTQPSCCRNWNVSPVPSGLHQLSVGQ